MGAGKSKQIAEQVIAVCQQVNDDDQIDEILLEDRTFQESLAALSVDIPASLRQLIITRKRRNPKEYGKKDITEHRAFKSLWKAPQPVLEPSIKATLYGWYNNPKDFVKSPQKSPQESSAILPDEIFFEDYIVALYKCHERRKIDSVRWRLFLVPLAHLFEKFGRERADDETYEHIKAIISGCTLQHRDKICDFLPSFLSKSKRYRNIGMRIGYGGLCALPEEPGDSLWETHLPMTGPVHEACIKMLNDDGIEGVASENITGNDQIVTANTAAKKVVDYYIKVIDKFKPLVYNPAPTHQQERLADRSHNKRTKKVPQRRSKRPRTRPDARDLTTDSSHIPVSEQRTTGSPRDGHATPLTFAAPSTSRPAWDGLQPTGYDASHQRPGIGLGSVASHTYNNQSSGLEGAQPAFVNSQLAPIAPSTASRTTLRSSQTSHDWRDNRYGLTEDNGGEQLNADGNERLRHVQPEMARSEFTRYPLQADTSQSHLGPSILNPQAPDPPANLMHQPEGVSDHRDEPYPVNGTLRAPNSSAPSHTRVAEPCTNNSPGNRHNPEVDQCRETNEQASHTLATLLRDAQVNNEVTMRDHNGENITSENHAYPEMSSDIDNDPSIHAQVPLGIQAPFQESFNSQDVQTAVGGMGSQTGNEQHHQTHQPRAISSNGPSQNYLETPVPYTLDRVPTTQSYNTEFGIDHGNSSSQIQVAPGLELTQPPGLSQVRVVSLLDSQGPISSENIANQRVDSHTSHTVAQSLEQLSENRLSPLQVPETNRTPQSEQRPLPPLSSLFPIMRPVASPGGHAYENDVDSAYTTQQPLVPTPILSDSNSLPPDASTSSPDLQRPESSNVSQQRCQQTNNTLSLFDQEGSPLFVVQEGQLGLYPNQQAQYSSNGQPPVSNEGQSSHHVNTNLPASSSSRGHSSTRNTTPLEAQQSFNGYPNSYNFLESHQSFDAFSHQLPDAQQSFDNYPNSYDFSETQQSFHSFPNSYGFSCDLDSIGI